MKKFTTLVALVAMALSLQYCSKKDTNDPGAATTTTEPVLPATPFNYNVSFPGYIQNALNATDNTPADNAITNDGATLGRVLFYDKHLSKNNTVSCGNCHQQQLSFDDNVSLSKGFDGGLTTRNSMALLNVRFYKSGKMFWDERSLTLEKQALQPIQNHVEMNLTLAELEQKVAALDYYPALFQKAFGSATIDSVHIAKALSQFIRSIVTYQSKYDQVKQGQATFTQAEAQGEQTFLNAGAPNTCGGCHTAPMFITSTPVTGFALLDANDLGINNQNRFKSGSLRNIALRTHLFHNGSVANLQAMLTAGPGTANAPIPQHSVAPQDVQNLIAFLNTLTDNSITTDVKFSDPFKQ